MEEEWPFEHCKVRQLLWCQVHFLRWDDINVLLGVSLSVLWFQPIKVTSHSNQITTQHDEHPIYDICNSSRYSNPHLSHLWRLVTYKSWELKEAYFEKISSQRWWACNIIQVCVQTKPYTFFIFTYVIGNNVSHFCME